MPTKDIAKELFEQLKAISLNITSLITFVANLFTEDHITNWQ